MATEEVLLSITDAAQELRISAGALREAANRHDIPVILTSRGARYFRASDVTTYGATRRKNSERARMK